MRSIAREEVFKYLYSDLFNEESKSFFEALLKNNKLDEGDRQFAKKLLETIKDNFDELMGSLSNLLQNYKIERLYSLDKCALLIGMAEIKYFNDIPTVVSINEVINLVKVYSTEKSIGFVNGVLAEYAKQQGDK
ncbi:MAG: transcription antitermination factor NusB [Clostridiales bacterium]|nr:transcription antitermination factor NusB [Clostridiales bacterium]